MHSTITLTALAMLASSALAETVHGVVVYSRHGDRTTKHYGSQMLTDLGAQQNFQVGSAYRSRYLTSSSPQHIAGISPDKYVPGQIYASAPDQSILLNTATAFLQGLYPPLVGRVDDSVASTTLNNGSKSLSPLGGYQYVLLHGKSVDSPDAVWIKGDNGCPTNAAAAKSFFQSEQFAQTDRATRDFYGRLYDVLAGDVYDLKREDMTYRNAYDIYDLINVARIHNGSSPARNVSVQDLQQLRTLADSAEFGYNFNASQPARNIHGRTLAAGLLRQLNQTVATKAALKFSLLAGSYDTFQSFFGAAGLTSLSDDFFGLPDYASTMAFELFSNDDDDDDAAFPAEDSLRVRFLFRNGTDGAFEAFPLFGSGEESLPWARFSREMEGRSIVTTAEWCGVCESKMAFCAAFNGDGGSVAASQGGGGGWSGMSNAVAGVVGALVALAAAGLVGGVAFMVSRRRRSKTVVTEVRSDKLSDKGSVV
ncbi:uncharacterized protein PgNI_07890 [Pyricularia grisea]|uniref:Uncharacterized protein n=1 Tax=Pyricularia grisea TaxID=148305 RepID=A0A6P8B2U4_PYRGI|nr:uncharacterized protein PgNI_07890 [Pyricularia grisea]TLD09124.1 hypothetical protein PgNI_07890 [Pyricularia grisea]